MIELFLDNGKYDMFVNGTYKGHELKCQVHTGSYVDSCLIFCPALPEVGYLCRYFLYGYGISFYGRRIVDAEIVVHNVGLSELVIRKSDYIVIPPGGFWRKV